MTIAARVRTLFRNESPVGLAILLGGFLFGLLSNNYFYIEVMILAAIYAIFAMSWDILTGYTHEVNFGFAFFIGGAGYISGICNLRMGLPPYTSIVIGALAAGLADSLSGT